MDWRQLDLLIAFVAGVGVALIVVEIARKEVKS